MRVLQYRKPFCAQIIDAARPVITADQALARNVVSNVSAGTEMAFYRGTAPQISSLMQPNGIWLDKENNLTYPMASNDPDCWWMGYASVAEVVEVGANLADDLKVGDLIFTAQCHKEFQVIDANNYQMVPAGMSPEVASFKTLTEIAYNGFLDSRIKLLDNVVIFGMGTLGQLLVQLCKMAGANVIAVDYLAERLDLAARMGADYCVNPSKIDDIGEEVIRIFGVPADIAIEVSGNSKALNGAVKTVKKNGQVTVLSFYQKAPDNFMMGREFHHNRIVIKSSQIGGLAPELSYQFVNGRRAQNAMKLLEKLNVKALISHECMFEDYPEVIKEIDQNPSQTLAVVIKY